MWHDSKQDTQRRVHFLASPRTHSFSFLIPFLARKLYFCNVVYNTSCRPFIVLSCDKRGTHAWLIRFVPACRVKVFIWQDLQLGLPRSRDHVNISLNSKQQWVLAWRVVPASRDHVNRPWIPLCIGTGCGWGHWKQALLTWLHKVSWK